jgi:hypothetical protein
MSDLAPDDDRDANPSGLPDDHPNKTPQPIPADHHEDGHEDPPE